MSQPIRAEVVNAFLEPALALLRTHLNASDLKAVKVTSELPPPPAVSVDMVLRGKLVGPVRWTFAEPVAEALASGMGVEAMAAHISAPECLDAMAEVANIIAGNATGALENAGFSVELQPPQACALVGPERVVLDSQALEVTLKTPKGEVRILFSLRAADEAA